MSDIMNQIDGLSTDRERLKSLLALEKQRRGLSQDTLVFVGMANVAKHWWCTEKAVLKSRAIEADAFAAYLRDRLEYAVRLGLIDKWPATDEALLHVGSEITLDHVEHLLKENARDVQARTARA